MDRHKAIKILTSDKFEGKEYSVDPIPTYAGITNTVSAFVGVEDPRNLTDAQIDQLYINNYWLTMGCDKMPDGLDFAVFQAGVNVGPQRAVKWLQAIIGAHPDGVFGPLSQAQVKLMPVDSIIEQFLDTQDAYYDQIAHNGYNDAFDAQQLKGWHNRVENAREVIYGEKGGTFAGMMLLLFAAAMALAFVMVRK